MTSSAAPDVIQALRGNPAALSHFEALAPSHKTEYLTGSPKRLAERAGFGPDGQSVGQE
ncbi:MAG: YdeI/OmpD-associated family protein [Devosia nanyangense]|uniref:YdeI/OmpD-associated family protein n=1 Tax=Devosia nanyangense TaxID=1228055 RepID=A0A933P0I0_9HYPH|nr:YdeI/OmpD-associated family protein [Devosia nanyangense]